MSDQRLLRTSYPPSTCIPSGWEQTIVAESAEMRAVVAKADRIGRHMLPVLISGETGTGKELIARRVHRASKRPPERMVTINCGAISPSLISSALFGHVRGAFTGAETEKKGLFEAADGGTLFLDEIGELTLAAQAALLRALETKRILRVGSTSEIEVDVRIVSATHRDLDEMVARGAFRQDLLFRLNTLTLDIPPLRKRPADIEPLAKAFLRSATPIDGVRVESVGIDALFALRGFAWPGNVRELKNAIEHAVVMCEGSSLRAHDLPEKIRNAQEHKAVEAAPESVDYAARMRRAEVEILASALALAGGRQTEAARLLAMPLRTLKYRLAKLGVRSRGRAEETTVPGWMAGNSH